MTLSTGVTKETMAPATLSLKTLIQNAKHFKMPVFLAHAGVSRARWFRETFRKSSENFYRNPLHSYFRREVTQPSGKKQFSERQTPGSRRIETDFRAFFAIRTRLLGHYPQNRFLVARGLWLRSDGRGVRERAGQ